jgi:CRP-like cAMP-binding protein
MVADDRRQKLQRLAILARLSEAELDELAAKANWLDVVPGEQVVSHLAASASVYFVIEGLLRVRLATVPGRQVAIRQLDAGAMFGEIAALTNTPRTVDVIAETSGVLVECSQALFLQLIDGNAGFARTIATALARNVVLLTDRVFELAALEVRFRIYAELLRLAHNSQQTEAGVLITNAPTHEMIAATIGAQREAVTRELRFLASDGVLRQSKREICIIDIERLRRLVQRRAGDTTSQAINWQF